MKRLIMLLVLLGVLSGTALAWEMESRSNNPKIDGHRITR